MTYLEGGDDDVGWVDTDGDGGGVRLLNVDSVDVDNPLLSVDLIISPRLSVPASKPRPY
jgi:hypothetical protein